MSRDDQQGDPAKILQAIDEQQLQARKQLAPDTRLLYGSWGAAWLVGFTALYLAFIPAEMPLLPFWLSAVIAAAALVAAIAFSATHSASKGSGSRGPSMVLGAIFGNIFPVALTLVGLLGWRLASGGVSPEMMLSYWVTAFCLVIGVLFVAGAVLFNDRSQLIFGCWTLLAGLVSVTLPPPHNLLAGVAGGLGFLALAFIHSRQPTLTSGPITRVTDG